MDDKLGGKAVQHREVQDFESEKFLSLFSPGIRILQGFILVGLYYAYYYIMLII
jgi:hypothetical protein